MMALLSARAIDRSFIIELVKNSFEIGVMSDNFKELLQALKNPSSDEWYEAIDTLTVMMTEKLDDYLRILETPPPDDDPEDQIRGFLAEIVGESRDPRAFEVLIEAAGPESDFLQERAVRALGKLGDKRAIGLLVAHLRNHWNPDVREEAAWALANYPEPWVIRVLVRTFIDSSHIVRDAVTSSLVQIGEAARGEVLAASKSGDPITRRHALETLAELDKELTNAED